MWTDLEQLVQSYNNGLVVLSFGSILTKLPDDFLRKLLNAFSKRDELFLMRYETMEFSLNGAELSLNSVNSGNSENLRNH